MAFRDLVIPIVVATYLPGEGHFRSDRYQVDAQVCVDDLDYFRAVDKWWGTNRPIVNVEHDVAATDDLIDELLACDQSLCSGAYRCHWYSTGIPEGRIAAGNGDRHVNVSYHLGGEESAEWSAIGLIKVSPEARVASLMPRPWSSLEISIEESVARPWHMHWGPDGTEFAAHHHW